jgi:hypothetical protein
VKDTAMTGTTTPDQRSGERRAGDRRKASLPVVETDRRTGERRSTSDRRGDAR